MIALLFVFLALAIAGACLADREMDRLTRQRIEARADIENYY